MYYDVEHERKVHLELGTIKKVDCLNNLADDLTASNFAFISSFMTTAGSRKVNTIKLHQNRPVQTTERRLD